MPTQDLDIVLAGGGSQSAIERSHAVLAEKSKSFALAGKFLPPSCRDDVAVIYAFCRHIDDAIDLAPRERRKSALAALRVQIDAVFAGAPSGEPVLDAFSAVARARQIPRVYVDELLAGMEMDVAQPCYQTLDELYLYAHRVAGVVGLLLCHVMGLREVRAPDAAARRASDPLRAAAHLGIAMQLTNICRDVEEDLRDGRVYLPRALLGVPLEAVPAPGSPARKAVLGAVERLLDEAARLYRSADAGFVALPLRCALAVRTASLVYAAIGDELRARGCDPFLGRAVVPGWRKLLLVARAFALTLRERARDAWLAGPRHRAPFRAPERTLHFPADVLPAPRSDEAGPRAKLNGSAIAPD